MARKMLRGAPPQPRISVSMNPTMMGKLEREASARGISCAEVLRQAFSASLQGTTAAEARARIGQPEVPAEEKLEPTPENFVRKMRDLFSLEAAAASLDLDPDQANAWLATDPELYRRAVQAQQAYIAEVEQLVVSIGKGMKVGDRAALLAFLEAHHPFYGRVKAEVVRRQLRHWVDLVVATLRECVGGSDTDHGRLILEAFTTKMAALEDRATKDFTD